MKQHHQLLRICITSISLVNAVLCRLLGFCKLRNQKPGPHYVLFQLAVLVIGHFLQIYQISPAVRLLF